MLSAYSPPVVGFAAPSGTGKTTLLCQLLPRLRAKGMRVSVIKHAHHDFDIDIPGKDSYELRKAGAVQTLVASCHRQALITETGDGPEPGLDELLQCLDTKNTDIVLVEGFKKEGFPKIELYRADLDSAPLYQNDKSIIAIAADAPIANASDIPIPVIDLNQPDQIVDFILLTFNLQTTTVA